MIRYRMVGGKRVPMEEAAAVALTAEQEQNRLETERNKYIADRLDAYPSLAEQLDMLWHDMDLEILPGKGSAWYEAIKAVKAANPKPE